METDMHVPFASREEFEQKAARIAEALKLDQPAARELLAQMAGYASSAELQPGAVPGRQRFSREELMARLQSELPEVSNDAAGKLIDGLGLALRDTDMEHIPSSPDAAPNIGG
jgi:hypothetical protein